MQAQYNIPEQLANAWELFLLKARYREARLFEFKLGKPILLTNPAKAYVVYSGLVDVFAVEIADGEAVGPRSHMFRASMGYVLMGMDLKNHPIGLLLSATPGTELLELNTSRLVELAQDPEFRGVIGMMLENWVNGLSEGTAPPLPPRDFVVLQPKTKPTLKAGEIARPRKSLLWVKHLSGNSHYLSQGELPLLNSLPFPISENTWLKALEESQLEISDTTAMLGKESSWEFLNSYHDSALTALALNTRLEEQAERERMVTKSKADQRQVSKALARIAAALGTVVDGIQLKSASADPLLEAAQLVGDRLGIVIKAPPVSSETNTKVDPMTAIARASQIRTRRVALEAKWYEKDSGPLLGYIEEPIEGSKETKKYPVALLPTSDHSYELYNPATKTTLPITLAVSETLSKFGVTFYRSFPTNRVINALSMLRFGLQDSGQDIRVIALTGVGIGLLGVATPLVTGYVFDHTIPEGNLPQLALIALALFVSTLASLLFQISQSIAVLRTEGKADAIVQSAIWDRLMELPPAFFRDYTAGDLAVRGMGISFIRKTLSGTATLSILSGIFSIFNLLLLFYYNATLALVAVVMVIFAVIVTTVAGVIQVRRLRVVTDIQGKISGYVLQFIGGMAKFRVAGAEARVFAFWADKFSEQRNRAFKARTIENFLVTFASVYPVITTMIIFAMLGYSSTVDMSIGEFVAFNSAFTQFLGAGLQLASAVIIVLAIVPTYERTLPIIRAVPEVDETKAYPGELTGRIEVTHVSFRYREDSPVVLNDVSFEVERGQFVALVGASGSGKSTILRLMLGFDAPTSGAVLYDGQDLKELDLRAVRQQIGVVLQNSQLMSGSDIFTNIVGATTLTIDDAWEAAKMVGLAEDIKKMPMGMHTVVAEGGSTLSGGQRQRILIARSIVTRPRILFFDEATSALDNKTQAVVSQSLDQLDATRIVIAHRLSTIINADKILVVDKGRIVQTGTYKQLMEQRGLFAELAKRQLA